LSVFDWSFQTGNLIVVEVVRSVYRYPTVDKQFHEAVELGVHMKPFKMSTSGDKYHFRLIL